MPQSFSENPSRKGGRPLQRIKNDLIYYSARALIFLINCLPFPFVSRLGRGFGSLVYGLAGGERRKTLASIRTAFPKNFSHEQVERLARTVWVRLGQNLFEVVRWHSMTTAELLSQVVRGRGWEHLDKALSRGKGAFVVTGHLGNWELLGAALAAHHPTAGLAQKLYDPRFDDLVTEMRTFKLKASMIKRGLALRGILEALKDNKIVYALVDQDSGNDGVFVPFFGKDAWTQSGVARIARKTGAAVVPAFLVRGADGRFEFQIDREIEVRQSKDFEGDVLETVRRYTEAVESYVKAYPDQWMWMHERWKTRPQGETTGEKV